MAATDHGLEGALEELYSSDPAEFTKKRDALAKALKAGGDAEAATTLKARRKPTQIAWVLNSLARKHPDDIADLVDIGRELAREQRKALRGEAVTGLKGSIDRQRKAIHALAVKATAMMKELGVDPSGNIDDVTSALSAAVVDPVVGAQLEEGRLEKAPEAAVGFGGALAVAVAETAPARTDTKAHEAAAAKAAKAHEVAEAKAERAEKKDAKSAKAAKAEAARAAKEAKAAAARAAKAAKAEAARAEREAHAEAARVAKERAAYAKDLAAAKADAKEAASAATRAQHAAERAEKEAREAIARAKELADEAAELATAAERAAKAVTRLEANAPA